MILGAKEFAALLPQITEALPQRKRIHADEITHIMVLTRHARTIMMAAAGKSKAADAVESAKKELTLARARFRWHRGQDGPQHDRSFNQAIMAAVGASVRREDAMERLNAERMGVSEHIQTKRPVPLDDSFKVQAAWELASPPFRCSAQVIAQVLVAAGLEPTPAAAATYPDRSLLADRVRKWLRALARRRSRRMNT